MELSCLPPDGIPFLYNLSMKSNEQILEEGLALHREGNFAEAESAYNRIPANSPCYVEALFLLGSLRLQRGDSLNAKELLKKVLRENPKHPSALKNLGIACQNLKQLDEAEDAYRKLLALTNDDPEAHYLLGNVLYERKNLSEAILRYRKSISLKPNHAEAYCNLAVALHFKNQLQEALENYRKAISLQPELAKAHNNMGALLQETGNYDGAARSCLRAISLQPDDADAHMNLAMILLLAGNYEKGWQEYEWRQAVGGSKALGIKQPVWDGSPLNGKRIHVYAEQGLGDAIQFVRYLPEVRKRGGYVIFECQKELCPLMKGIDGADEVVEANPDNQMRLSYDEHVPLLSLPRIFGTRPESVPSFPSYLSVPAELDRKWSQMLKEDRNLKVGIAWAGAPGYIFDQHRSCRLEVFSSLSGIQGVSFYNLQFGAGVKEPLTLPQGMGIKSFENEIKSFAERAALIRNLDLTITVDTSIGHLAGALGKKTWLLLSAAPDWRWLLEFPDTTPWYPETRLFRQTKLDDWSDVFTRVRIALRKNLLALQEKGLS